MLNLDESSDHGLGQRYQERYDDIMKQSPGRSCAEKFKRTR
jgi:hypothetical protein